MGGVNTLGSACMGSADHDVIKVYVAFGGLGIEVIQHICAVNQEIIVGTGFHCLGAIIYQ